MNKYCVGIDIGTSSVKVLGFSGKNRIFLKKSYTGDQPADYLNIVKEIIDELIEKTENNVESIAFSSQTGTYVVDDEKIIKWNQNAGKLELDEILKTTAKAKFLSEIQMNHPALISYPLPRLLYIKKNFKNAKTVCQLKDYLVKGLTGNFISDYYTWRGLYNFEKNDYSRALLKKYNLEFDLPKVVSPDTVVGEYRGIKVVVGLNDFYSAVLGIGALKPGTYFDITGTSEHVGFISEKLSDTNISSRYLDNYVTYGVTQSSGPSIKMAFKVFPNGTSTLDVLKNNPPIFLPYMNGERAPIYDLNARGIFFGLNADITDKEFYYSIYEGMTFSLYDILRNNNIKNIIVAGGAANFELLNSIKATLFNADILVPNETESSAYGAYLIAKHGLDISAISNEISYTKLEIPHNEETQHILLKRFKLFKEIYKTNKNNFELLKEVKL